MTAAEAARLFLPLRAANVAGTVILSRDTDRDRASGPSLPALLAPGPARRLG